MRPPRCAHPLGREGEKVVGALRPSTCGSPGGKCAPMSPSASAPRMASTSACSGDVGIGMAGERRGHAECARRRARRGRRRRRHARRSRWPVRISASAANSAAAMRAKSSVGGELDVAGSRPRTRATVMPAHSASAASSVKSSRPAASGAPVRGEQRRESERLRGLHRAQPVAVEGVDHQPAASTCLKVSVGARPGIAAPPAPAAIARAIRAARGERAGGVVHQDDARARSVPAPRARRAPKPAGSRRRTRARSSLSPAAAAPNRATSSRWITGCTVSMPGWVANSRKRVARSPARHGSCGIAWACRRRRGCRARPRRPPPLLRPAWPGPLLIFGCSCG